MKPNSPTILVLTILWLGAALALVVSQTAMAQQQLAQAQRVAKPAATSDQLSAELQRQLESESARLADPNCGSRCEPSPGSRLKDPSAGGGTRYTCNSGNCACSGACQCVAMEDICMPDTMGCSDYGCTCKQKSGTEATEPNC